MQKLLHVCVVIFYLVVLLCGEQARSYAKYQDLDLMTSNYDYEGDEYTDAAVSYEESFM